MVIDLKVFIKNFNFDNYLYYIGIFAKDFFEFAIFFYEIF